jgi:hypothetical protein
MYHDYKLCCSANISLWLTYGLWRCICMHRHRRDCITGAAAAAIGAALALLAGQTQRETNKHGSRASSTALARRGTSGQAAGARPAHAHGSADSRSSRARPDRGASYLSHTSLSPAGTRSPAHTHPQLSPQMSKVKGRSKVGQRHSRFSQGPECGLPAHIPSLTLALRPSLSASTAPPLLAHRERPSCRHTSRLFTAVRRPAARWPPLRSRLPGV